MSHRTHRTPAATALIVASVGALLMSTDAAACGGCFGPPTGIQVVTDHRMVLSLSPTHTVLWDQIRYSGRPSDFSWILPLRNGGDARIELGNNQFVAMLDTATAPALTPPSAPVAPVCDYEDRPSFASADGGAAAPGGVQVLQESVVGPYMTVTLRGDDPMALRNWLRDNGYSVPTPVNAVIDYYVGLHMDFVALKLRPGEGVDRMQPVRITSTGYVPTLPLRMIAAGVADKVGLLLMVLAPSRIEAMNFPNGELRDTSFTYDFNAPGNPTEDFGRAFDALNRTNRNRLWLTEASIPVERTDLENGASAATAYGFTGGSPRFGGPVGFGGVPQFRFNRDEVMDDVRVAMEGLGDHATLTRLRADLGASSLDQDLNLAASMGAERTRFYGYGHVLHMPPTPPPCGNDNPVSSMFNCAVDPGAGASSRGAFGLLALGLAAAARRRSRR